MKKNSHNIIRLFLANEQASADFSSVLAKFLAPPLSIGFSGEIGMGKTTLVRFLFKQMGILASIKSPTFSLVETYQMPTQNNRLSQKSIVLHHFDLYRIHDESELDYIGFRDYFDVNSICCIEWPEKLSNGEVLDLLISLARQDEGRAMSIQACSVPGDMVLRSIKRFYAKL